MNWSTETQRALSWALIVVGVLLLTPGAFLAISGVGSALGLPLLILAVVFLWAGWSSRPKA